MKTRDIHLIEDLRAFATGILCNTRGDVRFTLELVRCTEEGRLPGWAWRKERIPV